MAKGGSGSGRRAGGGGGGLRVISENDFISMNRTFGEPDDSFTRATANVSAANLRRAQERYNQQIAAKYDEISRLRQEYRLQVASGNLRPPTRIESLLQRARGNADNASTQAARRLLDRQGINWR